MLWLAVHFPYLPAELAECSDAAAAAVIERAGQRQRVLAANARARSLGITAGMDVALARLTFPPLNLLDRSPAAETRALKACANAGERFTSGLCLDPARWILWLEIGASLQYFGGAPLLTERVRATMSALGYTVQLGAAPTLEAAAFLALASPGAHVETTQDLKGALSALPIAHLSIDASTSEALRLAGIEQSGELLKIPAAALSRRFGTVLTHYLQRLIGTRSDPRPRYRVPERFKRRIDCPFPLASVEALLFPLRRTLQELQAFLRSRDGAVQAVSIALRHRNAPDTMLHLRLSSPQREAPQLFAVLRETCERLTLASPVTGICVRANELLRPNIKQSDLFDRRAGDESAWESVLDRIRARLGETAVRKLALVDHHQPERAWCSQETEAKAPNVDCERPLWIVAPQRLQSMPTLIGTPERIETGWSQYDGESRDYYFARAADGTRLWVYRNCRSREWYLQGLWG